jgi:HSP20 family molecular chaperone IbpA
MSARKQGSDEWSHKIGELLDQMHNRSFFEFRRSGAWQPRVNLYASAAAYHVCVELAGLERDAIGVECPDERRLRIVGRRSRPTIHMLVDECSVEVMEIDEGGFSRDIELPMSVDRAEIQIAYERGFLWITLPKSKTT